MKASKLLEQSAEPFDKACMQVKELEECVARARIVYNDIIHNASVITTDTKNFSELGILLNKLNFEDDKEVLDVLNYGGSSSEDDSCLGTYPFTNPQDKAERDCCHCDSEDDCIVKTKEKCKHHFKYDGHGHNYDVYRCNKCGHEEHR